jgi:hypothetical protein
MLSGYYCAKNTPAEVKVIIEMGIKKKVCSLTRVTMQIASGRSREARDHMTLNKA